MWMNEVTTNQCGLETCGCMRQRQRRKLTEFNTFSDKKQRNFHTIAKSKVVNDKGVNHSINSLIGELIELRPNLKNLILGLNLGRGSNMVGST